MRLLKMHLKKCLEEAGADIEALSATRDREYDIADEYTSDVVVVGGGGAGLSAAVAALENGASVTIIEKTDIFAGNSILAGGFMNAVIPELQDYHLPERSQAMESSIIAAINEPSVSEEHAELQAKVKAEYEEYLTTDKTMFDSENWFALQTWNGGDKVANLDIVKKLTSEADDVQRYLQSIGLGFRDDVFLGGGALYTRSRFPDEKYANGTGYIFTLEDHLYEIGGDKLNVLFGTEGKELIVEEGKVVGVKAYNKDADKDIIVKANNGVVMATGGFAGNVELRVQYCQGEKWPYLGEDLPTSNTGSVTGDGIFMAEKAGANLVNMEQIQLLPYCDPESGIPNNLVSINGSIFLNKEGKRFVREDGRRDEMSKAILEQTDGIMYTFGSLEKPIEEYKTLAGIPATYYIENNIDGYVYAETLEELAEKLNMPYENVKATIESYNEHVENDTADEFGRVSYTVKINPDGPFLAYPRKPAAHHTMGGVEINTNAEVLNAQGNPIDGLYAAGEITGVVHGGNRLGGNAVSDFLVFGKTAGTNAAKNK